MNGPRPGYAVRFCPVCKGETGAHREPVNDERREVIVYHEHDDSSGKPCRMSGKAAAIRAVAFTHSDRRAS